MACSTRFISRLASSPEERSDAVGDSGERLMKCAEFVTYKTVRIRTEARKYTPVLR